LNSIELLEINNPLLNFYEFLFCELYFQFERSSVYPLCFCPNISHCFRIIKRAGAVHPPISNPLSSLPLRQVALVNARHRPRTRARPRVYVLVRPGGRKHRVNRRKHSSCISRRKISGVIVAEKLPSREREREGGRAKREREKERDRKRRKKGRARAFVVLIGAG